MSINNRKLQNLIIQFLRNVPLFSHFSNSRLFKFKGEMKVTTLLKGEKIFKESEVINEVVVIYEGECIISKQVSVLEKKAAKQVHLTQIGKSECLGAQEILQKGEEEEAISEYTVIAISEKVTILQLSKAQFFELVVSSESDKQSVMKVCQGLTQLLESLYSKNKQIIESNAELISFGKQPFKKVVTKEDYFQSISAKMPTVNKLCRFLEKTQSPNHKGSKISNQKEESEQIQSIVCNMLPARIQQVRDMVLKSEKSEEFSREFYMNSNQSGKAILDEVRYDPSVSEFNLYNDYNIVYNTINLFDYKPEDVEYFQTPRAYKQDLVSKIEKSNTNLDAQSPTSPRSVLPSPLFFAKKLNEIKSAFFLPQLYNIPPPSSNQQSGKSSIPSSNNMRRIKSTISLQNTPEKNSNSSVSLQDQLLNFKLNKFLSNRKQEQVGPICRQISIQEPSNNPTRKNSKSPLRIFPLLKNNPSFASLMAQKGY